MTKTWWRTFDLGCISVIGDAIRVIRRKSGAMERYLAFQYNVALPANFFWACAPDRGSNLSVKLSRHFL